MLDQLIQSLYNQGMTQDQVVVFLAVMALLALFAVVLTFLVLQWVLKRIFRSGPSFDLVVLQVLMSKYTATAAKEGAESQQPKSQEELAEKISIMETIFANIAGLRAQRGAKSYFAGRTDHMSFEIVLKDGLVYFYVAVPRQLADFIQQQIQSQLPNSEVDPVTDYNIFSPTGAIAGCMMTFKKEYIFPLKTYKKLETDPIEALTNSLSKMEKGSGAAIQYVIRSARSEWHNWGKKTASKAHQGKKIKEAMVEARGGFKIGKLFSFIGEFGKAGMGSSLEKNDESKEYRLTQMEQEVIKGIEEKASKGGLDANVRILVSAPSQQAANQYLDNISNSFAQYNIYEFGNALKKSTIKTDQLVHDFIYREFDERHAILVNSEEMTSLFHFPLPHIDTPNIVWLQAKSAPAPINVPSEGLYLGDNVYRGVTKKIHIKREDRRRHMYVIGMTGTGKSKWLDSMVIQDILNGEGVCFIDPHGDDVDLIINAIPKERAEDVIIFDPADYDRPIGLNMLEYDENIPQQKIFAINEMLAIFDKLYDLKATGGPMFEQYMRNALMLIMDDPASGSTLLEISRVLADEDFRNLKLSKCKTPVVKDFWEKEATKAGGEAALANMVPYITSKLTPFIANDLLRPIISQQKSSINFADIMNNRKILLVKLSKGKIGDINANLLGMIIIGKLLMAALGRSDIPEKERKDFYLYIDEFQNFLTESINVILSEARKYRLSLTIAHQFLGQLVLSGDEKTKKAIFGNVGTKVAFRIGVEDAEEMTKEFSPVFSEYDFLNCPAYHNFVKLMVDNANPAPFNMRVPNVEKQYTFNQQLGDAIRQLSRLKYGRDRSILEAEVMERVRSAESAAPKKKTNPLDELFG